jgi:hypothetical protein
VIGEDIMLALIPACDVVVLLFCEQELRVGGSLSRVFSYLHFLCSVEVKFNRANYFSKNA